MVRPHTAALVVIAAASLSACGGGGGGGATTAAATVVSTPAVYDVIAPTAGDYYSYKGSSSTVWSNSPTPVRSADHWWTDVMTTVNEDGSRSEATIGGDTAQTISNSKFSADDVKISSQHGTCHSIYSPAQYSYPKKLLLSTTWDNNWTAVRSCAGVADATSHAAIMGSVAVLESVTVPAGTFDALKLTEVATETTPAGSTYVDNRTLWRDVLTGRVVKVTVHSSYTPAIAGANSSVSDTISELSGYSSAKAGRQHPNVERFAGAWQGSISGPVSGSCYGKIWPDGRLEALCGDGQLHISGNVSADGSLSFIQDRSGQVFTGHVESPLKMSGVWSSGAMGGTWDLQHQ